MTAARPTLTDRIREALEAEITSGEIPVGARLDEPTLMSRFGVSRTPVREAVLQLVSGGLVSTVPRQGNVVTGISASEYIAMLEVLIELEGLAARLAARRMPAVRLRQLKDAHADCRAAMTAADVERYRDANRRFHETIYDGSLNAVLSRQLRTMRLRMRHPQKSLVDRPGRLRSSFAEHQRVFEAIGAGDEDGAQAAMTGHISSGGNLYADAIASLPQAVPVVDGTIGAAAAGDATALTRRAARRRPPVRS